MTEADHSSPPDWPTVTQSGTLTAEQVRALDDQYWPCETRRSVRHRYHRVEPIACRDATIRWNQYHRGAIRGMRWQRWPRRIVPREWTCWVWLP